MKELLTTGTLIAALTIFPGTTSEGVNEDNVPEPAISSPNKGFVPHERVTAPPVRETLVVGMAVTTRPRRSRRSSPAKRPASLLKPLTYKMNEALTVPHKESRGFKIDENKTVQYDDVDLSEFRVGPSVRVLENEEPDDSDEIEEKLDEVPPIPVELLRVPGFVGEVMDYCLENASYPIADRMNFRIGYDYEVHEETEMGDFSTTLGVCW